MKVCFLVGSMAISGGTYVIVQHAAYLRDRGFDVTLAVQEPFSASTLTWHDEAPKLRCVPIDQAKTESFDLVIATWWKTAFELGQFNSQRHAYFVQSIESRFYPEEEAPLRALVDSTYQFPVTYVTEATWIRDHLSKHFGQTATLVRNGIRKDIYQTTGPTAAAQSDGQPRVLVEGHFGVPFKNTALSIRLAREAGAKDIWLLTGSPVRWIPGVKRIFSRVPMWQTAEIYRSCDILIKLSTVEGMFGPPLEIFHCGGTAVVFDVTGHDEYIVDGVNARVIPRGDAGAVVRTIRALLNDRAELRKLKDGALRTAKEWPSWEQSSDAFLRWVETALTAPATNQAALAELAAGAWADYGRDEQQRLRKNPRIVRRHKLSALAARLPATLVHAAKRLEAVLEVASRSKKAY